MQSRISSLDTNSRRQEERQSAHFNYSTSSVAQQVHPGSGSPCRAVWAGRRRARKPSKLESPASHPIHLSHLPPLPHPSKTAIDSVFSLLEAVEPAHFSPVIELFFFLICLLKTATLANSPPSFPLDLLVCDVIGGTEGDDQSGSSKRARAGIQRPDTAAQHRSLRALPSVLGILELR